MYGKYKAGILRNAKLRIIDRNDFSNNILMLK